MKYAITISDLSHEEVLDFAAMLSNYADQPDDLVKQPPELHAAAGVPVAPVAPQGFVAGDGAAMPVLPPVATPAQATIAAAADAGLMPVTAPTGMGIIAQAEAKEASEAKPWVNQATPPDAELDKDGLPWDERIHSSSKKQTKKGVWSKRKNLEDGVFEQVIAELKRSTLAGPVAATVPGVDNDLDVAAFMERNNIADAPVAPPLPAADAVAPVAPVAPPLPAAADTATAVAPARDFNGFMQQIQNLFAAGDIETSYVETNVIARINEGFSASVVTITDIANDQPMVDYAWKCLEIDGKIQVA